jgi:hypothetical protein
VQGIDRGNPLAAPVQHQYAVVRDPVLILDLAAPGHVRLPDEEKEMELLLRRNLRGLRGPRQGGDQSEGKSHQHRPQSNHGVTIAYRRRVVE